MPAALLVPIFIFLRYIQNKTTMPRISIPQSLKNLGIVFGITIPMVSWWYLDAFAAETFVECSYCLSNKTVLSVTMEQFIQGFFEINWSYYYILFFHAFWGDHGVSFQVPPNYFFLTVMIMVGISTAGLGYGIVIKIKRLGRKIIRNWKYQSIFALSLSIFFIVLAQSIISVQFYVVREDIPPLLRLIAAGWYTFIASTAISMVLLLGYRTIIINTRLKRFKNSAFLWAFIILIIFSSTTFYWLLPHYYVGF